MNLSVAPGYIIIWHPPASCGCHICTQLNPSTVKVIPWYLRLDAHVPWSTARSEVNMLQYSFINIKPRSPKQIIVIYKRVPCVACYEIAEGFRFMTWVLLGWEPFGSTHGLVGCKIEAGVNAGARERMEVSLRCHNSPRRYWVTRCGWHHAPEARGSLCENLKKIRVGF